MTVYPPYGQSGFGTQLTLKRKIFVSYHHRGDQHYYNEFSRVFGDQYQMIFDNSLERQIDSDDANYIMRRIREEYLTGTSCTVVLVGRETWGRRYVDWEISATLDKQHGVLGLQLPTLPIENNGVTVPDRLLDNIQSQYAVWKRWDYLLANPNVLKAWIEEANAKSSLLINNFRQLRLRNA